MGICGSNDANRQDMRVQNQLIESKNQDKQIKKLLLLGAGSSGKTTFFKQLKCIHKDGFSHKDKLDYKAQIYSQIIEQMQKIIMRGRELIEDYPDDYEHLRIRGDAEESANFIEYLRREVEIGDEVASHITNLWHDPGIRSTFDIRHKLAIPDSCSHFFNNIERISSPGYMPTTQDILYVRKRTTGIIEEKFNIKATTFHIFDVGGQRNERKKWIHCFEAVTAVIFVASLSSYNEVLLEDENVNVMHETLTLFDEICNSRWFTNISFILFLNKSDLFTEKLEQFPLQECFPQYKGGADVERGLVYIRTVFESKNKNPKDKTVFTHVTCATDRDSVEKVFNDVQHIVINTSLHKGGLL